MLSYDRLGSGPPLVLLHGIGHSRTAWAPVVDDLAVKREVFTPDLPGHGASPLPEGTTSLTVERLTDLVEEFITEAGLERPAVAGNSLGGGVALELLRRGAARSAVALSPIGFWSRAEIAYAAASLRSARRLGLALGPALPAAVSLAPLRAAILAQYFAHPLRLSAQEALDLVTGFIQSPGLTALLPHTAGYRFTGGPELPGPVTLAWGDRERLLIGGQPRRAKAQLPSGRHVRLAGCGHVPMIDAPGHVASVLLSAG